MSQHHWGKESGLNGPGCWHKAFLITHGKQQSPVEIQHSKMQYDGSLKPPKFSDPSTAKRIVNNGHSFKVKFDDSTDRSCLGKEEHWHAGACSGCGEETLLAVPRQKSVLIDQSTDQERSNTSPLIIAPWKN
uniref:Alpha-carbonic anhydrase domain-containing protein n=1 Tax=Vombatus ursinus TaxID=29139 RepID=A0A4X2L2D0_VOMUR